MKKIALWEAKHPKTVLLLAVLLLIPALIGFACTGVNYDILSYLPDELESMQGEQVLDETFNTAGISIVITEDMQPKYTLALKNEILKVDGVASVIWVDTLADIGIPADALPDVLKNIFYSADGTKTMMLVRYDPAGGEGSDLKAIAEIKTLLGENAFMSGLSVIVDDTREICDSQAPLYIAVAVALALAVMALMMESWFQPLIVLLSLGIAVLYNMGTNFFLGEISFITQCVAAVLQLGVTMDYSIFLIDRYSEEKEHYPTREEAMAAAVTKSFAALAGSSLTTVFGFLALCFMHLKLGFDIGFVMAKGVLFGILTVVFVLPSIVLIFEKQILKYRHRSFIPDLTKVNVFTLKHKKAFALIFLLLLAPSYLIQKDIDLYYSMNKALPVIDTYAGLITEGAQLPERHAGVADKLKSGIVNSAFYAMFVKAKKFYATDACISCGKCAVNCLTHNIELKAGKPVWDDKCVHCMKCICDCPEGAIEYGKVSVGKPRYHCPEV